MILDRNSPQDSRKRNIVILLLVCASLFLLALVYSLLSLTSFSFHTSPTPKQAPPIHKAHRVVIVDSSLTFAPLPL
ncbi:hypothetical protein IFO70_21865 [Phormidium tenue FACHB-886]|nr:hypothetical protein [Phormidium tenue FACHB-886]